MSTATKITLNGSDGETFKVEEAVAFESQTIKHMIKDDSADIGIHLPKVASKILSKVIEYCKKHVETPKSEDRAASVDDELKAWDSIEILKRLQREAFSDLMKLRDRQDKVERMISFYNTSKRSPFQEASTHVRGEVDVLGAILMLGNFDQLNGDAIGRAGIRTGIDSRFIFETTVREKDTLKAEFVASKKGKGNVDDIYGSPLSLKKVLYMSNVADWFSAVAIPFGAQCRDFDVVSNSSHQVKGLTDYTSFGPPLLSQHNGSGIGLMVKKSNVIASLAQSVCGLGMELGSLGLGSCFSTFGQVVCQLPKGVRLSLLGLQQVSKWSSHRVNLGALTIPINFSRQLGASQTLVVDTSDQPRRISASETVSFGLIALKMDIEIDESTRLGGWVEMKSSNPKHMHWAVTMSDNSEDELGWGMSFSGMAESPKVWDQFQVESYVKLSLGKKFSLRPGLAYVMDGNTRTLAVMLGSNWTF